VVKRVQCLVQKVRGAVAQDSVSFRPRSSSEQPPTATLARGGQTEKSSWEDSNCDDFLQKLLRKEIRGARKVTPGNSESGCGDVAVAAASPAGAGDTKATEDSAVSTLAATRGDLLRQMLKSESFFDEETDTSCELADASKTERN